jgi:hypothetical protein
MQWALWGSGPSEPGVVAGGNQKLGPRPGCLPLSGTHCMR